MVLCKLITAWSGVASLLVWSARVAPLVKFARNPDAKFIAGVPVLNYHQAYSGVARVSLAEDAQEHWVVTVKPGITDNEIEEMCKLSTGCELTGHPEEGGVPFFSIHATESELEELLSTTAENVEFIEPDLTVSIPDDEDDDSGYPDAATSDSATWGLGRIGASERVNTGSGVGVYILDTGVRSTHVQFGGRAVPTLDMTDGSLRECSSSRRRCAKDRRGHGTHCAGTAGGESFGVARRASVLGVKVLDDDGRGSNSWGTGALDWIATRGSRPAVASLSLGGQGQSSSYLRAIDTAVQARVTVVVAAGNDNSDACEFSPAYVPSAITVGSTTSRDERSSFSNYGTCVNIWAPGSSVWSADREHDSDYSKKSGTSMACPHVSGAAALALQASPSSSPSTVLSTLRSNAERDQISDLQSGDTNRFLNVRGQ